MSMSNNGTAEDHVEPGDENIDPNRRVLLMVRELHQLGYERIRVRSFISALGSWRCGVIPACWVPSHPLDLIKRPFRSSEVSYEQWQYTSSQDLLPFWWQDAEHDTPSELAAKFIDRTRPIAELGSGPDPEYAAWFKYALDATAPNGVFAAYVDNVLKAVDGVLCEASDGPWNYLQAYNCSIDRIDLPPHYKGDE